MATGSSRISVDAKNRLIVEETYRESFSGGKGKISACTDMRTSCGKKDISRVTLDGRWALTQEHELTLHVLASQSHLYGKTIILRGDIERVDSGGLAFRVRRGEGISGLRSSTIEFKGWWCADNDNRITFNVSKARGEYDVLRFQGDWKVNKYNEIEYRYTQTSLRTKTKRERVLIFKGHWDVLEKRRIVYRLEGGSDSFFSFKAALESPSLSASSGRIKYQIGVGYTRDKVYESVRKTITISGFWKLCDDLKVAFEVGYSGGRHSEVTFSAEKVVFRGGTLRLALKSARDEKLAFEVSFRKAFTSDAELFLALARSAYESRIEGGLSVRF